MARFLGIFEHQKLKNRCDNSLQQQQISNKSTQANVQAINVVWTQKCKIVPSFTGQNMILQ